MRILAVILSFIGALLTGYGFYSLWMYFSKEPFDIIHFIYVLIKEPNHYSWEFGIILIFTARNLLLKIK
jgi:hypothetical protein